MLLESYKQQYEYVPHKHHILITIKTRITLKTGILVLNSLIIEYNLSLSQAATTMSTCSLDGAIAVRLHFL